jgi:hypothetical protein
VYELIASAFLENYILVRPGCRNGMKISYARYKELAQAAPDDISPASLVAVARCAWDPDISDEPMSGRVLVGPESHSAMATPLTNLPLDATTIVRVGQVLMRRR